MGTCRGHTRCFIIEGDPLSGGSLSDCGGSAKGRGEGGSARKVVRQANSHGGDKANHRALIGELSNSRSCQRGEYCNVVQGRRGTGGLPREQAQGIREREII